MTMDFIVNHEINCRRLSKELRNDMYKYSQLASHAMFAVQYRRVCKETILRK